MKQEEKERGLITWLDKLAPWETFFTGTTHYAASNASLQRTYEGFMKRNYKDVSYVYTLEPHADHGFHVHAMFDKGHDIKWKDFWKQWYDKYGRNRTEPILHRADVESYVTKYICKTHDQVHRDKNKEIWWNVKLSKYRKRIHHVTSASGSSAPIDKRVESSVRGSALQTVSG